MTDWISAGHANNFSTFAHFKVDDIIGPRCEDSLVINNIYIYERKILSVGFNTKSYSMSVVKLEAGSPDELNKFELLVFLQE